MTAIPASSILALPELDDVARDLEADHVEVQGSLAHSRWLGPAVRQLALVLELAVYDGDAMSAVAPGFVFGDDDADRVGDARGCHMYCLK